MYFIKKIFKAFERNIVRMINHQKFLILQIDINNACNLNCKHCYHQHHHDKDLISKSVWEDALKQFQKLSHRLHLTPFIIICGGEPFLSPNFRWFIEIIKREMKNSPIAILTNGTIKYDSNYLNENSISLQISIDGAKETSHDYFRGKGNFVKTIENIRYFIKNEVDLSMLAVLTKSAGNQIDDFFKLAQILNVRSMNFTRFIPTGHGNQILEQQPTPLELKLYIEKILTSSKLHGVKTNTKKPLFSLVDPKAGANSFHGFSGVVIDYKGNIKISSRSDYAIGNVKKDDLAQIYFKNKTLKELRKGNIQVCSGCYYFSTCGGDRTAAYVRYGSFLAPDPDCWIGKSNTLTQRINQ